MGYDSASLQGGMKAWGEHYAIHAITESADLAIYQVSRPARGCLSYVIASDGKAIVIDPLRHLWPYLDLARDKGFTIATIIDTHGHADHISGGTRLGVQDRRALLFAPLRRDSPHGRASGDDPVRVHSRGAALSQSAGTN